MANFKVIWSHRARIKLYEILEFYAERNKSKSYPQKLYRRINKELKLLEKQPDLGIKTDIEGVRGLIVGDYLIFYEMTDAVIAIHTLWDCRQNPKDLTIK